MLIITRTVGQMIRIELDPTLDPETPVGRIFAQGPIEIMVAQARGAQIRLGITAPEAFAILRDEVKLAAT